MLVFAPYLGMYGYKYGHFEELIEMLGSDTKMITISRSDTIVTAAFVTVYNRKRRAWDDVMYMNFRNLVLHWWFK